MDYKEAMVMMVRMHDCEFSKEQNYCDSHCDTCMLFVEPHKKMQAYKIAIQMFLNFSDYEDYTLRVNERMKNT